MDGGGSSTVLRSAGTALPARWTSVTTRTWRAASSGRRWARVTMDRASSTSREGPVRSTTTRSGWVPARALRHVLHWPHPPDGHNRAAARPRAAGPPPRSDRTVEQVGMHRPARRRHQLGHRSRLAHHRLEQGRHRHARRVGRSGQPVRGVDRPGHPPDPGPSAASSLPGSGPSMSRTPDHTAAATSASEPVPSTTNHGVERSAARHR